MKKKAPLTTKPLDYFQHNERKHNPRTVALDVVEWTPTSIKAEPAIAVKETANKRFIERAKRAWNRRLKDIHNE